MVGSVCTIFEVVGGDTAVLLLHLPDNLFLGRHSEVCFLLFSPQHEVVIRKRVLAIDQLGGLS